MARKRPRASGIERRDPAPPPASPRPSGTSRPGLPARRVVVIGAGADVAYGIPTVANLMYELGDFARGEGERVHELIKHKIKSLRFTFDKFASERSQDVLTRLFADPEEMGPKLRKAAEKLRADEDLAIIGVAIEKLCGMADYQEFKEDEVRALARTAGMTGSAPASELLLVPGHFELTELVRTAIRKSYQQIFARGSTLTAAEKNVLELFVASTSDIEQLLSDYFARYAVGSSADRRTYLYIAWMLWSFLRVRSSRPPRRPAKSAYDLLPAIGDDVVTFNYTNLFHPRPRSVHFFHGRLDQYLKLDTRELVTNDRRLQDATDVASLIPFLDSLRLDVTSGMDFDLPAIVPPTAFKPIMSREQLLVWADVDGLLQKAELVVIIGYSFARADAHFNDLLRKGATDARFVIVNTDPTGPAQELAAIIGLDPSRLQPTERGGFDILTGGRITAVHAHAEDLDDDFLVKLLV